MTTAPTTASMLPAGTFQDRTIVITGGGTGLGRAMGQYLLSLGARLAICGRRREVVEKSAEEMAAANKAQLNELPNDIGGQVKGLTQYDFMDDEARQKFQELVELLKQRAMDSYARELSQRLQNMEPESLAGMRHLIEAINQMMEQRMRGEEPDFEQFMQQFGDYFGDNPPKDLDELMERLQQQMAQAQALLDSLSPEDRESLQDTMMSMIDETQPYPFGVPLHLHLEKTIMNSLYRERQTPPIKLTPDDF